MLDTLYKAIKCHLTLCLGVIIQLLIDDEFIKWDPVGNIQDAGPSFIGVIAFVLFPTYLRKNKPSELLTNYSPLQYLLLMELQRTCINHTV